MILSIVTETEGAMYPVWEVPHLTAGMILALIATFHMLPVYLSTSAMWFLVWLEYKSVRRNRPELMDFVRRYARLVLIFSYVFGALSGVGIWFSATVAAPRAISGLIHNYVWGWATEWVFFLIEIAAIYVYYYTLDKADSKTHLKIGAIFALSSWTTMVVIVGILTFMLTPGRWAETGGFFDGFFNPTYWPQLLLRTTSMFAVGGAYVLWVAPGGKDAAARDEIVRAGSILGLAGAALGAASFAWYASVLPDGARETFPVLLTPALKAGLLWPCVFVAAAYAALALKPRAARPWMGALVLAVAFCGIWSFERVRELIRKPYLIPGYMYSNQLIGGALPAKGIASELDQINAKGILSVAPFVPEELRTVTPANRLNAGRMVALIECSACHTLDQTGLRPLPARVRRLGAAGTDEMAAVLDALGSMPYMPPFAGTDAEKRALADYLLSISK
ncbi:MAG: cytochrome ubiquinol oxidase subunit I [Elusimicrobiota bacterium]